MTARIFLKNNFYVLLAFSMLFCFFPNQQKTLALHYHFYCETENGCGSVAHDIHLDRNHKYVDAEPPYYCGSWQACRSEEKSFMSCTCDASCLDLPGNFKYLDEPVNRAGQRENLRNAGRQDANNINLPVVLAWDNIPGWTRQAKDLITTPPGNLGEGKKIRRSENDERTDTSFDDKGPKSYRIQIQDTSASGIDNLNITASQKNNQTEYAGNKKAFYKVLDINAFNSRDDGGECFFKNNTTYRWRVKPCCDRRGTECRQDSDWQTFKTSAAPEPLGIIDKNHPGTKPSEDPDWNGKKDRLKNVDVCSAKILWCRALLIDDNNQRFSKIYNNAELDYAANYQMRVNFSENWSLNLFGNSGNAKPTWQSILGILADNPIAKAFSQMASQAVNGIMDYGNKESCHYLEKQKDGTCKPETVSFSTNEAQQTSFKPFFSATERKNQNRNLFTGDMNGNLTYSWQTKVCFNVASGKKDDKDFPFCSGYNDKDYGQKWKFSGSIAKVEAPALQGPPNNPDRDDKNLIGTGETIQWTVPCGANSFLYDIKEKDSGQSIFKSDKSYPVDGGRRATASQTLVTLTDKTPVQGSDPQNVNLQINKFYTWRVKSCWPSLPVGGIASICSDKWSDSFYFYTTGRKPKIESLKVSDAAPTANLAWESVPGAKSYRVKISGMPSSDTVVGDNQFSFTYPGPSKPYTWQVKTCADGGGNVCGAWSDSKSFNSGDFKKPWNLNPSGTAQQLPYALSWEGDAKSYQVTATFSGTADSSCDPDWYNKEYKKIPVSGNTLAIKSKNAGGSQYCTGDYWFKVQPCFDSKCTSLSNNYNEGRFRINDPDQKNTGFMVCGQKSNNTDTSYNEKESCEIRHLVLTVKVIIDFITFKLAFILLPILLLITGYFFYTAHGDPKIIETMKDAWRKIGIGYAFLIFAFLIVRVLMFVAGYGYMWWQVL